MHRFTVVIPAFNEKRTIADIVEKALKYTSDIIVVDDGSIDGTIEEISHLPIKIIQHATNQGKAASLWDGFMAAISTGSDAVITLDGDGQHSPEDIPLLLDKAEQHPDDIIIGARLADKESIPRKRYYANRIANFWISWASGYQIEDSQSGFRLYPVKLLKNININTSKTKSFVFESEILIKAANMGVYSRPVRIPAIYSKAARPSHFHGTRDITYITLMVASELLKRGMNLPGLYKAWIKPYIPIPRYEQTGIDGYFTLFLSIMVILFTLGISYLAALLYIFLKAKNTQGAKPNGPHLYLLLGRRLIQDNIDNDYRNRLECAIKLLKQDRNSSAIILGGFTGKSTLSEAAAGKNYMICEGVAESQILVEEFSRNTLENFQHAKSRIQNDSRKVVIISNRYHIPRSMVFAHGFSIDASAYPAEKSLRPIVPSLAKMLFEALHLHWYLTGKYFARLTNNRKMLARIS